MAEPNTRPGGMPHPADMLAAIDARTAEMARRMERLEAALERLGGGGAPTPPPTPEPAAAPGEARYAVSPTNDGHMVTDLSDTIIGEFIRTRGHFEETHIDRVLHLLARVGVAVPKSIFLDIGANIGTHSLHALRLGFVAALCIEPDPDNFRLLRINQILNGVDHRCLDIQAAASDREEEGVLERSPTNFGDFRVRRRDDAMERHDESQWAVRPVRVRTLDRILAEAKVRVEDIGLTWIDTQGHEGFVFAGGASLMAATMPIVCEFWPYGMERSGGYPALRAALAGSGRKVHDLRRSIQTQSLVALGPEDLDRLYRTMLSGETADASPHTDLLLV